MGKDKISYYDMLHGKNKKFWHYQCIMYLDSAPQNWKQIIDDWGVNVLVSPYHDKDVQDDGSIKKPHYHVIIIGNTTHPYIWAIEKFDEIHGVYFNPDPEDESKREFLCREFYRKNIVHDRRKAIRYLTHKDDANKYAYKDEDITIFGSIDYYAEIQITSDKYKTISEIQQWCETNKVYSYRLLSNFALQNNMEWFTCLVDYGTHHISKFLRSLEYDMRLEDQLQGREPSSET